MKLIISIVNKYDATTTTKALNAAGYYVTRLAATGGFLKKGNVTLFIGTDEELVPAALEIIQNNAKKRIAKEGKGIPVEKSEGYEPTMMDSVSGGVTVFVVDIDRFEKV